MIVLLINVLFSQGNDYLCLRVRLVNIEDEFQMDHLRRMALIKRHPQSKMYFAHKESMKKVVTVLKSLSVYIWITWLWKTRKCNT